MKKALKNILKIICIAVGAVILIAGLVFGYLTIREYRPEAEEQLTVSDGTREISLGDELTFVTYNIGYAGYDQDEDFFMDGGSTVRQKSSDAIESNLAGIAEVLESIDADVNFLQEVDVDSHRSFNINEAEYLRDALQLPYIYACNFKVDFVPYPIPPIGKVESGVTVYTDLVTDSAVRVSLPCPFKWPVRLGNLKRCVIVEHIPIQDSDRDLVLMNFHLEAYDNGEGKAAQTAVLKELLSEEYTAGNYVIAGGDFNQTFDTVEQPETNYPDDWMPGFLAESSLPDGFSFAAADNAATCRSLARSYVDEENSQEYIIDGFIVSDNIEVQDVSVYDTDFMYSDHNPVVLNVSLK